jgi:hypothetical protein
MRLQVVAEKATSRFEEQLENTAQLSWTADKMRSRHLEFGLVENNPSSQAKIRNVTQGYGCHQSTDGDYFDGHCCTERSISVAYFSEFEDISKQLRFLSS